MHSASLRRWIRLHARCNVMSSEHVPANENMTNFKLRFQSKEFHFVIDLPHCGLRYIQETSRIQYGRHLKKNVIINYLKRSSSYISLILWQCVESVYTQMSVKFQVHTMPATWPIPRWPPFFASKYVYTPVDKALISSTLGTTVQKLNSY